MSHQAKTTDGRELDANFTFDFSGPGGGRIATHRVGDAEFAVEEFALIATHFLSGGAFGWGGPTPPEPVKAALKSLAGLYDADLRRKPLG